MDKIEFMRLFDAYSGLLTPTQKEITDLYFNLDLTVSEIAEQKGVSRQAVSDCLNGCKKQFSGYEQKLRFLKLADGYSRRVSLLVANAAQWAKEFAAAHPEFGREVERLEDILKKDYSAEVSAGGDKKRG